MRNSPRRLNFEYDFGPISLPRDARVRVSQDGSEAAGFTTPAGHIAPPPPIALCAIWKYTKIKVSAAPPLSVGGSGVHIDKRLQRREARRRSPRQVAKRPPSPQRMLLPKAAISRVFCTVV